MENQTCVFLGIKVKPGPIERHKLENFALDNTVDSLKTEAEKKSNIPSSSLELIHHGKILKCDATLQDCGVKSGEMIHVVKKKVLPPPPTPPSYTDAELQQLNTSLRTLGCTPNAPGWTRAMQLLNDETAMSEIVEHAPSLADDCVTLSLLHEVELLAALGANVQTMRRGASAHPDLPNALRHLLRLVHSGSNTSTASDNAPTSGFAYSLEALSEDEDADDEDNDEGERNPITQAQLAAALQAATEGASGSGSGSGSSSRRAGGQDSLLRLLQAADHASDSVTPTTASADDAQEQFPNAELVFLGDFNAHHNLWLSSLKTDHAWISAHAFAFKHDLKQLVDQPTRIPDISSQAPSTLGLLHTTHPQGYQVVVTAPLGSLDHSLVSAKAPQCHSSVPR
ncbi:hypothetical protein evm_005431 [Chilo suppressalis]|nr:hypothetical protein evm_005431 [Chilo suppressalis]